MRKRGRVFASTGSGWRRGMYTVCLSCFGKLVTTGYVAT